MFKKLLYSYFLFCVGVAISMPQAEIEDHLKMYLSRSCEGAGAFYSVDGLKAKAFDFSQQLAVLHAQPSIQLKFVELFFYKLILLRVISSLDGDVVVRSKYAVARDDLWQLRQKVVLRRWGQGGEADLERSLDLLDCAINSLLKNFDDVYRADDFFPLPENVSRKADKILSLCIRDERDSLSDFVESATTTPSTVSSQSTVSAASAPAPRRSARRCDACDDREKRGAIFIVSARALLSSKR